MKLVYWVALKTYVAAGRKLSKPILQASVPGRLPVDTTATLHLPDERRVRLATPEELDAEEGAFSQRVTLRHYCSSQLYRVSSELTS